MTISFTDKINTVDSPDKRKNSFFLQLRNRLSGEINTSRWKLGPWKRQMTSSGEQKRTKRLFNFYDKLFRAYFLAYLFMYMEKLRNRLRRTREKLYRASKRVKHNYYYTSSRLSPIITP